jgi:hypothetical protein
MLQEHRQHDFVALDVVHFSFPALINTLGTAFNTM